MAITRLAGHQTCNKSLPNVFLTNRLYLTRRSYASEQSSRGGSQNLPQTSSSASKKSTRTKVKYSDLPGIYVPPSGVPSAPLKSWFADGRPGTQLDMTLYQSVLTPSMLIVEEQAPIDIAAKPARKRRSIKNKPRNCAFSLNSTDWTDRYQQFLTPLMTTSRKPLPKHLKVSSPWRIL